MRIAVMDFEARSIPREDALKLTEIIRNDIVNTGKFTVIERSQMGQIIKEQGLQQSGCTDVSCAVELGKILSAGKILVGTVMRIEEQYIITGRIVDVEKGVVDFSEKSVAGNKSEIIVAVSAFVEKLADRIDNRNSVKTDDDDKAKKEAADKEAARKEETRKAREKRDTSKSAEQSYSNDYTGKMILSLVCTGAFFGGGYYLDTRVKSKSDSLNTLYSQYTRSTDPAEITSVKSKIKSEQKESDKYILYRNISYGIGGAGVLVSAYYLYKYITYTPDRYSSDYRGFDRITVYPVMTAFNLPEIYNSRESFYGCSITFKF